MSNFGAIFDDIRGALPHGERLGLHTTGNQPVLEGALAVQPGSFDEVRAGLQDGVDVCVAFGSFSMRNFFSVPVADGDSEVGIGVVRVDDHLQHQSGWPLRIRIESVGEVITCTQKLLAPTWEALEEYVRDGGVVYNSFFSGTFSWHQSLWQHNFPEFTGNRPLLRYGILDLPDRPVLELRWRQAPGASTSVPVPPPGAEPYGLAFMPLEPASAAVLAEDHAGRPAVTRHELGRGRVYFVSYPWEYLALWQPEANVRFPFHQLYERVFTDAGLSARTASGDAWVMVTPVGVEGSDAVFLWVQNRGWEERVVALRGWTTLRRLYTGGAVEGEPGGELRLGPKAVGVWRVGAGA